MNARILSICLGLTDPATRADFEVRLANLLGVEEVLLFLQDSALRKYVPAPGFPQTLPGGLEWRSFLSQVALSSPHVAILVSPGTRTPTSTTGLQSADGSLLVVCGGQPERELTSEFLLLLPLVAASLRAEQALVFANGQLAAMQESTTKAQTLALTLDETRRNLQSAHRERGELVKQLERRAAEMRSKVEELTLERDLRENFVAALSHDLRTPLTAAQMSAQLLIRKADDPSYVHKLAARIVQNMGRADEMIRDLLDVTRIKAGEPVPLEIKECDLSAIARETVEDLSSVHGNRFVFSGRDHIRGAWDCLALRRMIENLAGNAVKYGTPGTPISISIEDRSEQVEVAVHNVGNPIAPRDQEDLFKLFKRSADASQSNQKGWGIGLTLVEGLAKAHGGKSSVKSSSEHGTTFSISLPRGLETSISDDHSPPSACS